MNAQQLITDAFHDQVKSLFRTLVLNLSGGEQRMSAFSSFVAGVRLAEEAATMAISMLEAPKEAVVNKL